MAGLGIILFLFFLFGLAVECFLCPNYSSIGIKMKKDIFDIGKFQGQAGWLSVMLCKRHIHLKKTWLMCPLKFLSSLNSVLWSSPFKLRVLMRHMERTGVSSGHLPHFVLNQQLLRRWQLWELNRRWSGWENIPKRLGAVQQSKD